jgi:hypothetical protein
MPAIGMPAKRKGRPEAAFRNTQKSGRSCTSACEEPQRLLGEFPMILEDAAVPRIREKC